MPTPLVGLTWGSANDRPASRALAEQRAEAEARMRSYLPQIGLDGNGDEPHAALVRVASGGIWTMLVARHGRLGWRQGAVHSAAALVKSMQFKG